MTEEQYRDERGDVEGYGYGSIYHVEESRPSHDEL